MRKIEKNCNLCRNSFAVWLTTLNFDNDKEQNIRYHLYNHCPSCKVFDKTKQK